MTNNTATNVWMLNNQKALITYAKKFVNGYGHFQDEEDLFHELYVSINKKTLPDLNSDNEIRNYIYTCLRHLCLEKNRRNQAQIRNEGQTDSLDRLKESGFTPKAKDVHIDQQLKNRIEVILTYPNLTESKPVRNWITQCRSNPVAMAKLIAKLRETIDPRLMSHLPDIHEDEVLYPDCAEALEVFLETTLISGAIDLLLPFERIKKDLNRELDDHYGIHTRELNLDHKLGVLAKLEAITDRYELFEVKALLFTKYLGYSTAEAAEHMGISESQVKSFIRIWRLKLQPDAA